MNPYADELVSTTAVSITDVSFGVVLVLCACLMLIPLAMLVGLLYTGIRNRRLMSTNEAAPAELSDGESRPDRNDRPRPGETS